MRDYLTKGEVAKLLNMTKSQIRFYEKKGLLQPNIDENGYAMYDYDQLDVLEMILYLKELDTPIKEIKKIIHDDSLYDYETIMRNSYESVLVSLDKLNKKKALLEAKLNLFNDSEVDTFKVDYFDSRILYQFEKNAHTDITLKRVYDIAMKNKMNYLDPELELCFIEKNKSERLGLLKENIKTELLNVEEFTIQSGMYISYVFSFAYDEKLDAYKENLNYEIKVKGYEVDDELIFIDHFARKFYEKNKGVGTFQRRILNR